MQYCINHYEKSYTEKQYAKLKVCEHFGSYQSVKDNSIRVYCFRALDGEDAKCPER